jgi:hypothetical protein
MAQLGRSSVSLTDLIHAGLLRPGQRLVFRKADGPGAEITSLGTIRYQGKEYPSLSTAAKAASGGTSTNGWLAWCVKDGDSLTSLAKLRDRHLNA